MFRIIIMTFCSILLLADISFGKKEFNFDKYDNFSSEQIKDIEIDVPYGNLEIFKSPTQNIEIYFRHIVFADDQKDADKINRDLNYRVDQAGDRLFIEMDKDRDKPGRKEFWKELLDGRDRDSQVLLKILVPDNKAAKINSASCEIKIERLNIDLDIKTASSTIDLAGTAGEFICESASGDVIIDDHEGNIEINSASSDLRLSNIKGNVNLSVASGDIDVENIEGDFDAESVSGDIKAFSINGNADMSSTSGTILGEDISGSSRTKTISGDISLKAMRTADGSIRASSISGFIHLEINPKFSGEIDLSSASGEISHSIKGDFKTISKNRIVGNIGNGNGTLNISSTSGDIVINEY